jgi:serine/threonine protein kinase
VHTESAFERRCFNDLQAIREIVCALVRWLQPRARTSMTTVPLSNERPEAPLFCDGLGERVVAADGATGELLQILRIRPALTAVPSFEFALRERAARLANFRHAYYARVRRIDRVQVPGPGLSIVSDHVEGTRLSDILRVAHERNLQLDINAALCLIRQLVPAVALLHENAREVAHGLIAPERLVVTPHARLVIVEHVLAAAVEQLQFSRDRLWQEFRISMPPSAGLPRFDHRADVTGVGLVALALVLGRPLHPAEFPNHLPTLLSEARERTALGEEQPLSQPLRDWLARALQLDTRRAFASAPEALTALEEIVADDSMYVAAPVALETFLSRYIDALLDLPSELLPVPQPAAFAPAPVATHSATSTIPSGVFQPAAAPAASSTAGFEALPTSPYTPSPAPAATHRDTWADAADPAGPETAARDITELIAAADLKAKPGPTDTAQSLFNPDAPFSVASDAPFPTAAAARFTITPPAAQAAPASKAKAKRPQLKISRKAVLAAAALIVVAGGGVYASRFVMSGGASTPATGTLVVQSNPAGVQVFVDGNDHGQTPARFSVPVGPHILELRGRGVPRVINVNVTAGAEVSQYLEFANTPETGSLRVETQPAGAKVIVDGTDRGVAPVTIADLLPGDHEVILQTPIASARHVVSVQAGGTASIVTPVASASTAAGPVSGWLTVKAPFSLEIREEGRIVGTTDADRLMLAAGRHDIELVNETLGYRVTRVVQVMPGKVASLAVDLPKGVVNLNASPWAEVWVDGQRVGETPIGNLSISIGPHEVVFRHPQFGEKRHAISVTMSAPTRVSVDMK